MESYDLLQPSPALQIHGFDMGVHGSWGPKPYGMKQRDSAWKSLLSSQGSLVGLSVVTVG